MSERGLQTEPFSGGLNNILDAALLKEGELTQCDNAYYKPNSMSIHKAPSRIALATSIGGTGVSGLRYCAFDFVNVPCVLVSGQATISPKSGFDFDGISQGASIKGTGVPNNVTVLAKNSATQIVMSSAATISDNQTLQFQADNLIIIQNNNEYKKANATTGALTFSTIETVTEGPTLEAIHYANRHVLLNGVNDNRVLLADGTTRAHGLEAVHDAPKCTTAAGTWALLTGTGYYSYWTTEYDSVNNIESTFDGKPTPVNVATTATKVIISQPVRINASATQWRVYRSTKMAATSDEAASLENVALSSGLLIGTAEIKTDGTQSTIEDGGGASSIGPFYPTTLGVVSSAWVNPSNALNNDTSTSATWTCSGVFQQDPLEVATFNITTSPINPPVSGITVFVRAKKTGNGRLIIAVWDSKYPPPTGTIFGPNEPWKGCRKVLDLTTSAADYTLGASYDLWGATTETYTWTPGSFANGTFSIVIFAAGGIPAIDKVDLYNVGVSVSYGKAQQLGTQTAFPAVTIKPFGEMVVVGRNGQPPKASIGDIFQGSLVLNDVEDESMIRYSFPDNIDAFPSIYFLNFETADQDRVSLIKTVGNNLVVALRSRLFRVSNLPRDVDAEFDRGRVVEEIDSATGVVGPKAGTVFTMADGTPLLFGVSTLGPFVTDGYRVRPATGDLNWKRLVDTTHMDNIIVINNPEHSEILVYYVPLGSVTPTILTKYLRFNYHPSHQKDGAMKVSGPCDCDVKSAALAVLRDSTRVLYTGAGTVSTVSLENQGAVNSMTIKSRQLYLAGPGNEWKLQEHYLKHTLYAFNASSPMNVNMTVHIDRTGLAARNSVTRTIAIPAYPSDGNTYPQDSRLDKTSYGEMCEGAIFEFATSNATEPLALDYHVVTGFGFGRENAQ